jgi:hypothetical protein
LCWSFPTSQIVAQQFSLNFLTSQDGILIKTTFCISSLPLIVAYDHAVFISFHVEKGVTSRLNTLTHSGISFNCFLFHEAIGAVSPQITSLPTAIFFQAKTYFFSQSTKLSKAILDVL